MLFVIAFPKYCGMVMPMVDDTALRDIVLKILHNARRSDIIRLIYDKIV